MRTRLVLMLVGGVLLATLPARAHHSFAAEFDVNQPVTLNGTLTKMEWLNPHGWIYVDVAQPDGKIVNWAIEAGAPTALLRRGLHQADGAARWQLHHEERAERIHQRVSGGIDRCVDIEPLSRRAVDEPRRVIGEMPRRSVALILAFDYCGAAPGAPGASDAPRKKLRPSLNLTVLPLALGAPPFAR